ncbi:3-oxoacyl-[acyl-carrier-protein] synthase III C-terminal domain-containing protein [Streptomyces sp. NBC_01264]|uniref:3-oxoacyl-[acyl-carrier-protein] synthase III C-terminal domain-containing protein n=1 Tax=Streptomyces sp. NBC_01264 TaxID=2903804 RepID=UPI00225C199A|nr:3-oxoacyl-[acyl-carrier-protein] synthase III C-terminal domain-containing protein [Streptomyces sp. NBC_01264]MCX4784382.1 hypothetical protein [Streptomyces sp. NBC_01264]
MDKVTAQSANLLCSTAELDIGAPLRTRLVDNPESGVSVVTAGDNWNDPSFNRWRTDRLLFGDGAGAFALSREQGFARILSMVTYTDPELEGAHRGSQPFGPFQYSADHPINLNRRRREFLETVDEADVWHRIERGQRQVAHEALDEAGSSVKEMDFLVTPHLGAALTVKQCLRPLGECDLSRTAWDFSRRTGHLGAADQLAGFNYLAESGRLNQGMRIMLMGVGGGFSWTCVVVEIEETPGYS